MKNLLLLFGVCMIALFSQTVHGQACQSSNASSYGSWTTGSNDNSFGAWTITTTSGNGGQNGSFTGNSGSNGSGSFASPNSPNINTSDRAWALYANSGQTAGAFRNLPFTMSTGHTLKISMDNGFIDNGGTVGIGIQNASGENLTEFYFVGGESGYTVNDNSVTISGISFSDRGFDLTYTVTASNTYNLSVLRKENGTTTNFTARTFKNPGGGQVPARIRVFNFNSGGGDQRNAFFNNITLCRPTITATGTLAAVSTTYGTVSSNTSFNLTGAEIYAGTGVTVTAPAGFQVSTNPGSGFASSINVGGAGAFGPTTVYVRLAATAPVVGTYNAQNIVLTTTGAANVNVPTAVSGNIVNAAALTITGVSADNKPFDGNNSATLLGTASYAGLQNGELFSVSGTPVATFDNASVGNGKPVTVSGYTAPSSNYTVSQPVGLTADIIGIGQGTADFRTKAAGNFSATSGVWEYDQGGNSWIDATQAPLSTNNVSITHNIALDQDYTVGSSKTLVLGTGGTLTVNPTRTLTVSGTANFAGQSVTFKSDNTGTASLGQVTGSVTGATNVTIERYIPNNNFRSWRLLSVPVTTSQTIRQAWQEGDANPNPKDNNVANYGTQITGVFGTQAAATAAGFDSTSILAGMLRWNGASWSNITSTTQAINNFSSYFLYIRGDRSLTVTGMSSSSNATTLRTRGTIFTGSVVNAVGAGAFALIPNRYPSAINFTGLTRDAGISNLFYIWDSKKLNGSSLGIYQTFSNTNSFNCLISGGSYTLGVPNTTIQSGQSFFVQGTSGGNLTLVESAKVSGGGSLGFRPTPSAVKSKIDSRLYNSNDEMLDANTVVFDAVYNKAVADEDAPKMGNPGANFAIETGSKLLAIEGTAPVKENDAIQFRMWNMAAGNYKLEFAISNLSLPAGTEAILEDSYTKTNTVLNTSAATSVNFTVDASSASSTANRFRIVIGKAANSNNKAGFTIAPNPIEGNTMNLAFSQQEAGQYNVRIVSANGQALSTYRLTHAGGNANQVIGLPAVMGNGTYTVEIVSPNKARTVKTVLVSKK